MLGTSNGTFQIPNNTGQDTLYSVNGVDASQHPSSGLNETQDEASRYGNACSPRKQRFFRNYQVASFLCYSSTKLDPDPIGDLIYTGVASKSTAAIPPGGSRLTPVGNSLRRTLYAPVHISVKKPLPATIPPQYFPWTAAVPSPSTTPLSIVDNNSKIGDLYNISSRTSGRFWSR